MAITKIQRKGNKMNRTVFTALLMGMAILQVLATETATNVTAKPVSPEFKNRREEIMMTKHGGLIKRIGTGEGHISLISVNNAVSEDMLKELASRYGEQLRMDITVSTRDSISIADAHAAVTESGGAIAIIFVKDASLPIFMMNADSRWGIVNVENFGEKLDERLAKMTARAIPDVSGVGKQLFSTSNFKPIITVEDIDSLTAEDISRVVAMGVQEHLAPLGVKPYKLNTYQKACEEGWAPAPANKYQQAIWDRIKTEQNEKPSNPIRIRPGQKPSGK